MSRRIKHPVLLGALVILLLSIGTAGAAKLITGKEIANHSITGKDIGTSGATIDDPDKFTLGICVDQGDGPEAIEEDEPGEFGVSPVLETGDRTAVTVSSGFFVNGGGEELFTVLLGPCVLNETTSPLDENDRTVGYVLASFPAL